MDSLRIHQEQALAQSKHTLEQYKRIIDEYRSLKDNLNCLTKKVNHTVLAPVCHNMLSQQAPLAYVPGYIDHTNEVLVLLGCNWFAKRSVSQASEMIDRRVVYCQNKLRAVEEEIVNLQKWSLFTEQIAQDRQELVEIFEEYNEEEEKKWREEHRKRVKQHKERERIERMAQATKDLSLEERSTK